MRHAQGSARSISHLTCKRSVSSGESSAARLGFLNHGCERRRQGLAHFGPSGFAAYGALQSHRSEQGHKTSQSTASDPHRRDSQSRLQVFTPKQVNCNFSLGVSFGLFRQQPQVLLGSINNFVNHLNRIKARYLARISVNRITPFCIRLICVCWWYLIVLRFDS